MSTVQAYGIVWKAIDKKTREVVALKKIFDAFQNATDAQVRLIDWMRPDIATPAECAAAQCSVAACYQLQNSCAISKEQLASQRRVISAHMRNCPMQRTFREIMFLQELNNHENIIRCVQRASSSPILCQADIK